MVVMSVIVMVARLVVSMVVHWVWMLEIVMAVCSVVMTVRCLVDYLVVK